MNKNGLKGIAERKSRKEAATLRAVRRGSDPVLSKMDSQSAVHISAGHPIGVCDV
jgi:hypothetical protein